MLDPARNSNEYKKWRAAVKKRDGGKCQWPGCKRRGKEVHHILTYSENPYLRHTIENGILFCRNCHYKLKGKETYYINFCMAILEKYKK
jgi:5-methylcytosine-specific restriction endonuclease McrA